MSGTTNVFGLSQPSGTTNPLAILAGSPAYAGIEAVVSALYGPGLAAAQIAQQTVADPNKVALNLPADQVGEEIYNDNATLGPFIEAQGTGLMLFDNSDLSDTEMVNANNDNMLGEVLHVLLGGKFEIVDGAPRSAFIVASAADGGTPVSHQSTLIIQPLGGSDPGSVVEDDVGVVVSFEFGDSFINEDGTGFLIEAATPAANPPMAVMMTGDGSNGQIDVGGSGIVTQAGSGSVTVEADPGGTYIQTGYGAASVGSGGSTIDMIHGDLTLASSGGDLVTLGDGTSQVDLNPINQPGDTIIAGSGALTVTQSNEGKYINPGSPSIAANGINATVFGGAGTLTYSGSAGLLVLGSGAATVGGGAAGSQQEVFGGAGGIVYNGGAERGDVIAGSGSVTVQAGAGGGWYSGGTNGNNSLTANGAGTVLVAGGNGDTLTGATDGWSYLVAGRGNETLVGGNQSGTDFLFGGSGAEQLDLGGGVSVINPGAGAETITGGAGFAQVWLTGSSGAALIDTGAGGNILAVGFRLGVDHIRLDGQSVAAEIFAGGTSALRLSGGSSIELVGVDATKASNLFG